MIVEVSALAEACGATLEVQRRVYVYQTTFVCSSLFVHTSYTR
jgi:hypothetical protein